MAAGRSASVSAVDAIFQALDPLDAETRNRVLASAMSLLGMTLPEFGTTIPARHHPPPPAPGATRSDRPLSVVELMQQKVPVTNTQKIALFAYYREKYEGQSRFSKTDLRAYFGRAREKPPSNYDRDFGDAVKLGWIHEDGDDSYLTSKGVEVVETGFGGKQPTRGWAGRGAKAIKKRPKKASRSRSKAKTRS